MCLDVFSILCLAYAPFARGASSVVGRCVDCVMRRRGRASATLADPPVGSLFRLRGGDWSGSALVRLLGFRENTGQCRYLMLPAHEPADFFFEFPSYSFLSRHCDAISWGDLSRNMSRVLSDVLSDLPTDHLVVRSAQSAGFCTHVVGASFNAIPLVIRVVPARHWLRSLPIIRRSRVCVWTSVIVPIGLCAIGPFLLWGSLPALSMVPVTCMSLFGLIIGVAWSIWTGRN